MSEPEILEQLEPIVRTLFDEYDGPVGPSLNAHAVPQWDSLANVQLMVLAEQTFGVRFTTAEIAALDNLGELAGLIRRKQG